MDQKPKLVIQNQPAPEFRFRYLTEMDGTHGSLTSRQNQNEKKGKKSYPEVTLNGYPGPAVIRCTLYQENLDMPSPHSHLLVTRTKDGKDVSDPHYFIVNEFGGALESTLKCQGMGIIHTSKKDIKTTLVTKYETMWKKDNNAEIGAAKQREFEDEAKSEAKTMNLNKVAIFGLLD